MILLIGIAVLCFLIGGIPFGFIAGKIGGIDIREHGSKNIGATNVMRVMGRKFGLPVFILDFLKAFVPVMVLKALIASGMVETSPLAPQLFLIISGLLVVLGHTFCPYLGFKGGKGVASSAGFIGALMPIALVVCLAVWLAVFYGFRYVSLASLAGGAVMPMAAYGSLRLTGNSHEDMKWYVGLALFLCFMVIWTHRTNIRRLMNGTENRFGKK
jgi:glycerol-3-phosphate acyltransferase PlsY